MPAFIIDSIVGFLQFIGFFVAFVFFLIFIAVAILFIWDRQRFVQSRKSNPPDADRGVPSPENTRDGHGQQIHKFNFPEDEWDSFEGEHTSQCDQLPSETSDMPHGQESFSTFDSAEHAGPSEIPMPGDNLFEDRLWDNPGFNDLSSSGGYNSTDFN